ncbi:protein ABA AND ROS SENSITIVE 1 isoform X2 [Silene latifolia]|uniref:protein ABA AND ROS SENSITIVE 1 isoform X2 n=1 Tax=Silene latifolia TaxID=37657 RepID=UPI003D78403F
MADRDRKKALFRAKLNERQQQKRIDSPLVRYNEQDKPVCRVCEFVLKSDSDWIPHQASRKHREAVNNIKAIASRKTAENSTKSETPSELPKPRGDDYQKYNGDKTSMSSEVKMSRPASALPAGFFDNQDTKRQKVAQVEQVSASRTAVSSKLSSINQTQPTSTTENVTADTRIKETKVALPPAEGSLGNKATDIPTPDSETKQTKGAIPEGFFDNKDADLRARGIEPVKPNVKDEYKEFEKLIQEDLMEVDNRFEEEEIDAAEQIEEEETREQRALIERLEKYKSIKMELIAARSRKADRASDISQSKSVQEDESSSEDDDEDDRSFAVDWRAKHI